jgi:hypothetical protein
MREQLNGLRFDGGLLGGIENPPALPIEVEHLMQDTRTFNC